MQTLRHKGTQSWVVAKEDHARSPDRVDPVCLPSSPASGPKKELRCTWTLVWRKAEQVMGLFSSGFSLCDVGVGCACLILLPGVR